MNRLDTDLARSIHESTSFLTSDGGLAAGVGDRPAFSPGSTSTCFVRVGGKGRVSGRRPGRLWTEREQRAGQAAEEVGFGTCRGERKANAARGLDDPGGDFQETKTQRRELGRG